MVDFRKVDGKLVFVGGTAIFMNNMNLLEKEFDNAIVQGVTETAEEYYKALIPVINKTTYSIKQLREMDHPYAKRHSTLFPGITHDPKWGIHSRSGRMAESLKYKVNKIRKAVIGMVGWDSNRPKWVTWVIFGTIKKMVPRNVLKLTWTTNQLYEVLRNKLLKYARRGIGKPKKAFTKKTRKFSKGFLVNR